MVDTPFTIASFDIGIKNLAFCVMQYNKDAAEGKQFPILHWINIDLTDDQKLTDKECEGTIKSKNKKCDKQAKVIVDGKNYCSVHNPKKETVKVKSKPKAASIPLKKLCTTLATRLDEYENIWKKEIDHVIIETQFTRNRKMICQSNMLYSYFVLKHIMNDDSRMSDIKFISSRNKLQVYNGPKLEPENKRKNAKDQRKMLAVEHCKAMIKGDQEKLNYLNKFPKKKDDLSDSFLQGAWYLKLCKYKGKVVKDNKKPENAIVVEVDIDENEDDDDIVEDDKKKESTAKSKAKAKAIAKTIAKKVKAAKSKAAKKTETSK